MLLWHVATEPGDLEGGLGQMGSAETSGQYRSWDHNAWVPEEM